MHFFLLFVFFKQKTAYEMRISDWSSDVCSSDLSHDALEERDHPHTGRVGEELLDVEAVNDAVAAMARGIADVASSLHRAEQKRWRLDPRQHLGDTALYTLERRDRIFNRTFSATLLLNLKLPIPIR